MGLKTLHVSQKMLNFLMFFALIAISQSSVILTMPNDQSFEESGDSGSESVESGDSVKTHYFAHVFKNTSYGAAVIPSGPTKSGADAPSITSRFGGDGGPAESGADAPSITSRFGGDGGPTESGADAPSITSRFGGSASGNISEPTTEIPSTTTKLSQDRSKSPVFNIWEFAKIAGPFHVRTGGHPNDIQQTSPFGLTRCEWAIISCCQNAERNRRNSCFSALHCGGAWFENPCSDRLQSAVYGRLLEIGPF